jgi:hypothetical protein
MEGDFIQIAFYRSYHTRLTKNRNFSTEPTDHPARLPTKIELFRQPRS